MAIRNLNWYNLQATRRYPLDDSCSGETDSGQDLPNDIIVDCHVRFSSEVGQCAYVQAVTVSKGLVTVIIGVAANLNVRGVPVAAVTVPKPANINVNYPLQAIIPGVAGWISLGSGTTGSDFAGRFSYPRQSLLAARCARPYAPLPIPSMSKQNVGTVLSGIVDLIGTSPVQITYKKEIVNDEEKQLVVFSLNQTDTSLSYNPLEYFLGPCGQRPESGTCPKTPIQTINGVAPDCTGNINIAFENMTATPFDDCGGVDLLTDAGLNKACEAAPKLPAFYSDACCPPRYATIAERDAADSSMVQVGDIARTGIPPETTANPYQYWRAISIVDGVVAWGEANKTDDDVKGALAVCDWPDPTTVIPDVVLTLASAQDYPALQLPICVDFCSCSADSPPLFDAVRGTFSSVRVRAPFGCVPCGLESSTPPSTYADLTALTYRNTYAAVDASTVSLSLFKNAASDWAFGRTITAQIKISGSGLARNGGVVINYRKIVTNGIEQTKYFAAVLDVGKGKLRLLDYTDNNYIVVAAVPMPVKTDRWYKLSVRPTIVGADVNLKITAEEMIPGGISAQITDYKVNLAYYEPQTGAFGLYAERSYTYFNAFTIA
jgi:hypothetical protein